MKVGRTYSGLSWLEGARTWTGIETSGFSRSFRQEGSLALCERKPDFSIRCIENSYGWGPGHFEGTGNYDGTGQYDATARIRTFRRLTYEEGRRWSGPRSTYRYHCGGVEFRTAWMRTSHRPTNIQMVCKAGIDRWVREALRVEWTVSH